MLCNTNPSPSITDGSQTGLDFTTAFTLSGWFKWESWPPGSTSFWLIDKFHNDVGQGAYGMFMSEPNICAMVSDDGSNLEVMVSGTVNDMVCYCHGQSTAR